MVNNLGKHIITIIFQWQDETDNTALGWATINKDKDTTRSLLSVLYSIYQYKVDLGHKTLN